MAEGVAGPHTGRPITEGARGSGKARWVATRGSLSCVRHGRSDEMYVPVANWIHRVEPDESLPNGASPYRMLFDRNPCTQ